MKWIKAYSRSTMPEERFSDLAVIATHYSERFEVEVDEICQQAFVEAHPRRLFQASLFVSCLPAFFNQTAIVVTLYSLSVLNDSVSYLTKLYQSEVKMKKIDIFKHYPPPYRIPLALGRLPRTLILTAPSVKKSWIRPCLYILIGAIKFISVRSS